MCQGQGSSEAWPPHFRNSLVFSYLGVPGCPSGGCSAIQQLRAKPVQAGPGATGALGAARGLLRRALEGHIPSARGGRRAPVGLPPFSVGAAVPGGSRRPHELRPPEPHAAPTPSRPAGACIGRRLLARPGVLSRGLERAGPVPMPRPGSQRGWAVEFLPRILESLHPCGAFQGLCMPTGWRHWSVSTSPQSIGGPLHLCWDMGGSLHPHGGIGGPLHVLGGIPRSLHPCQGVPNSRKNGSGPQIAWLLGAASVSPPKPKLAGTTHLYITTNQTAPPKI